MDVWSNEKNEASFEVSFQLNGQHPLCWCKKRYFAYSIRRIRYTQFWIIFIGYTSHNRYTFFEFMNGVAHRLMSIYCCVKHGLFFCAASPSCYRCRILFEYGFCCVCFATKHIGCYLRFVVAIIISFIQIMVCISSMCAMGIVWQLFSEEMLFIRCRRP